MTFILKSSNNTKIILPPSSAGIGNKFKTPIFIERITAKLAIEVQPNFDTSPTTLSIPTGPLISFKSAFPEKSVKSPPTVSFKIDINEFFAKFKLSAKERFVF